MDLLPPSPAPPPSTTTPIPTSEPFVPAKLPKRPSLLDKLPKVPSRKFLIISGISAVVLLLLSIVISAVSRRGTTPHVVAVTPAPSLNGTPSVTQNPDFPPEKNTERLALTALSGHQLVGVSTSVEGKGQLWLIEFTKEGPRKSLLYEVTGSITQITPSPNKQFLAFIFTPPPDGEPASGLKVFDLRDKSITDFITPSNKIYNYPNWSADSLYLSAWGNKDSNSLFDMTTKRRLIDVNSSSGGSVSSLVFIPNQPKIAYIDQGTLYESEYSGANKVKVLEKVNTVSRTGFPDLPIYSPDARFVVFHNSLGQLVLLDKILSHQQILAEGTTGTDSPISFGHALFFDPTDTLVYSDQKKDSYTPGTDDNPLYLHNPFENKSTPFFANPKTPVVLASVFPNHSKNQLILHIQGFMVFGSNGQMASNCDYTRFTYNYTSYVESIPLLSSFSLFSPDNKYIFDFKSGQIADTAGCAVSSSVDTTEFTGAAWLK